MMADIPKLEQLILTRLRGIIQDRLVHPNHLTMTLPRLKTSSDSKPIIADLGERAVEAVREGLSKAASEFVNINPGTLDDESTSPTPPEEIGLPSPPPPLNAQGPATPSVRTKRIPMPAGFPGYSASAMDTPTPGGTGDYTSLNLNRTSLPPQLPAFAPTASSSSAHASGLSNGTGRVPQTPQPQAQSRPGGMADGRTSSMAPPASNTDNSQFRFRGAFASQPSSQQGLGGSTATPSISAEQQRRLGVLNSRA